MTYIIVKYAHEFQGNKAHVSNSVHNSYTAREIGGIKLFYASEIEAEPDLEKLQDLNPGVSYGIVEAIENEP